MINHILRRLYVTGPLNALAITCLTAGCFLFAVDKVISTCMFSEVIFVVVMRAWQWESEHLVTGTATLNSIYREHDCTLSLSNSCMNNSLTSATTTDVPKHPCAENHANSKEETEWHDPDRGTCMYLPIPYHYKCDLDTTFPKETL